MRATATLLLAILSTYCWPGLIGLGGVLAETPRSPASLLVRAKVQSVRIKRNAHPLSASIQITVRLEFSNSSSRPIILLRQDPTLVGAALAKTQEAFATGDVLAADYMGPSRERSPEWEARRSELDRPTPPVDKTRILEPGESWEYVGSVLLDVPIDPERYSSIPSRKKESLQVLKESSPLYLRVYCDVWPLNLEPGPDVDPPVFGRKLQKRWHEFGDLWITEICSEPADLDLRTAEEE